MTVPNRLGALILILLEVGLPFGAAGQASFAFVNHVPAVELDAPIYGASGQPLEGTNYLVMLYFGSTPEQLQPAPPPLPFLTGDKAGYFFDPQHSIREVSGISGGTDVSVQVRAWDVRLGTNYDEAAKLGIGGYGESAIFVAKSGGCFQCGPAFLIGLKSFSLRPITGVLIRSVRKTGDQLILEWLGDSRRYQVQQTTALGQAWQNAGEPTAALSFTNTIAGRNLFFSVVALPE